MAIGHLAIRVHTRSKGQSAAAALANRFAVALTCVRTGERHDFSRAHQRAKVVACGFTPGPFSSPGAFAEAIETAERRKNSQLLRDVQVSLPFELEEPARVALTERFAVDLAARYATVAAWVVQSPSPRGDPRNHVAFVVLPTRTLDADGRFTQKLRQLNEPARSREEIKAIRLLWETLANEALCAAGVDARVHTGRMTLPAPTLGSGAVALERRAWAERHGGQLPSGMSAAALVTDDGPCETDVGEALARHVDEMTELSVEGERVGLPPFRSEPIARGDAPDAGPALEE